MRWPWSQKQKQADPTPPTPQRPYDRLEARRSQLGLNAPIKPAAPETADRPTPPLLFQHLGQPVVIKAARWLVVEPVRWVVVWPVRWLVLAPVHWVVYKPLHYLLLAPLLYGFQRLAPTARILGLARKIEEKTWEKRLDDLSDAIGELGLFKLSAALLFIVSSGVFLIETSERGRDRQYQAWSVVNTGASVEPQYDFVFEEGEEAEEGKLKRDEAGDPVKKVQWGSTGEGGRIKALQELYADDQSLAGLQAPGAYLPDLHLGEVRCFSFQCLKERVLRKSVNLSGANLEGAYLWKANLEGAFLVETNLEGAFLGDTNLKGADLLSANLEGADLPETNLEGASLMSANLKGAFLGSAHLEGASLGYANLEGASLDDANLEGADLESANLEGADLESANFEGAVLLGSNLLKTDNLTPEQLSGAYLCVTDLPPELEMDGDRDCAKLPSILVEKYSWIETIEQAQQRIDDIRQQKENSPAQN